MWNFNDLLRAMLRQRRNLAIVKNKK